MREVLPENDKEIRKGNRHLLWGLLILLVCAVCDLSTNVARIAKAMELLKKPTTAYQEGLSKKGCHTKGTWQRQIE